MPRSLPALVAALLSVAGVFAAPPTDAQIDAAIQKFVDAEKAATTPAPDGAPAEVRPTQRIKWADAALEGLDLTSLTPDQVVSLARVGIFPLSTKSKVVAEVLATKAQEQTVDGAEAAVLRLKFLRLEHDASAQQLMIRRALRHPKLQDALKQGRAITLFGDLSAARPAALTDILALKDILTPDMPPVVAARAPLAIDAVVTLAGDDNVEAREPLRLRLLEMVRAAQQTGVTDDAVREALGAAEKKLDGAFMRGELVGHPAPALDFAWSNFEPPVASLADLKGKVVVLDFWATWCGPCISAFPDVKRLQAHFQGYPVVIVGVTSLQGFHYSNSASEDCTGDPEKEYRLMGECIKAYDISWKIAFTRQSVFNPEYGVTAIPHVAIIDSKGIVRHRKMHPNSRATPIEDMIEKINALLKEANLKAPPPLTPASGG